MVTNEKSKGITLISLIVTIIVLIILASVSIAMLTGENGIIKQANKAKEETIISTEKEAIQLTMINREATGKEKYNIGEELISKELANGDKWKIIYVKSTKTTYGTGWNYLESGISLENYGKTKYSWVINYNTGEVVKLPEEETSKFQYGDNLAVKDGLILNADPINMDDEKSWGEGVTVYGIEEGDGYGWNDTEFKLDGKDDYIEIYPQEDVNIENDLTFEFYGKSKDYDVYMLSKTDKENIEPAVYTNMFRTYLSKSNNSFFACMSLNNSESTWTNPVATHWIMKENIGTMDTQDGGYLTMTVNIENNTIILYWNGEYVAETKCNHNWLVDGELLNAQIPFTIGLNVGGDCYTENYSKIDIYACRLYNKVLTEEEVKNNCEMTINYHNMLVDQEN